MTLREKQSLFLELSLMLMMEAIRQGYELTYGDTYRSPQECIRQGKANSVHGLRLAIDLNLFKDGEYLTSTGAHRPLGEYWKSLNPLCRWGGDFGDGNHYSLEHNGVK